MLALVQRGRASWSRLVAAAGHEDRHPRRRGPAPAAARYRRARAHRGQEPDDQVRRPRAARRRQLHARAGHDHARSSAAPAPARARSSRRSCRMIDVPAGTLFLDGTRRHDDSARHRCARSSATHRRKRSCSRRRSPTTSRWATAPAPRSRRLARAELERVGAAESAPDLSGEPRDHRRGEGRRPRARPRRRCPKGSGRSSASAASRCRAASASASRSPARSSSAPRLLVLDDSLSSVDAETERVILANLRDVMHGRTAVLISHRVAAIKDADQIIVLDQGKVVERGTHDELIAASGVYSELYRTQLETAVRARRRPCRWRSRRHRARAASRPKPSSARPTTSA